MRVIISSCGSRAAMALTVASFVFLAIVPEARASIVNYEFVPGTDFTLDATGTISGTFTYNTSSYVMTNIDVTISGATGFDGTYTYTYEPFDASSSVGFQYASDSASDNVFALLLLYFSLPLDGSPGLDHLSAIFGYNLGHDCGQGTGNNCELGGAPLSGGVEIESTPLPAALPLFATGLGAMGLFGWRRKRKNVAAVAH
jgi:hypothetical protein